MKTEARCLAIVSTTAMVAALTLYERALVKFSPAAAYAVHQTLINHTADAPHRYRVLVPWLVAAFQRAGSQVWDDQLAFLVGYGLYYVIVTVFSLTVLYGYLRRWFAAPVSLLGSCLVALSLLVAFGDGYFQPWSLLEIGLFALGLMAIYRRRHWQLLIIVLLAALNRETGVFIALAYPALQALDERWRLRLERATLVWSGVYLAVYGAIFCALRQWLGTAEQLPVAEIWQRNLQPAELGLALANGILFLGAFWWAAAAGWPSAPEFVRRSWRIVPLYVAAIAVWGIWKEVRLLTPLYAILIPTGLAALAPPTRDS